MSPEELLLVEDPRMTREPRARDSGQADARAAFGSEAAHGGNTTREPEVPPVRTIVLDRPPVPVAPPVRERNPLRAPSPSTAGPERLRLSDLSIAYAGKPAVKAVSLSIHQGEVLALIGPSGCGKTTLLRTLNRLTELTPSAARSGEVLLDGEDIHDLRTRRCARAWRWSFSSRIHFRCRSLTTSRSRCASSRASARAGASSSRW